MTTNNDYILARWRDAITDPPPDGWEGSYKRDGKNTSGMVREGRVALGVFYTPVIHGDQWLDITAIPGVAREAVQAAHEAGLMKLVACSVAALANTRESAKNAREILDEYKSASWYDVCAAVDREMDLRERTRGGVPRDAVQAAVDRLVESSVPSGCECPTCDAIRAMCRELGVTPSGVKESLTTREAPHA